MPIQPPASAVQSMPTQCTQPCNWHQRRLPCLSDFLTPPQEFEQIPELLWAKQWQEPFWHQGFP
jgi:hypothetical protein